MGMVDHGGRGAPFIDRTAPGAEGVAPEVEAHLSEDEGAHAVEVLEVDLLDVGVGVEADHGAVQAVSTAHHRPLS